MSATWRPLDPTFLPKTPSLTHSNPFPFLNPFSNSRVSNPQTRSGGSVSIRGARSRDSSSTSPRIGPIQFELSNPFLLFPTQWLLLLLLPWIRLPRMWRGSAFFTAMTPRLWLRESPLSPMPLSSVPSTGGQFIISMISVSVSQQFGIKKTPFGIPHYYSITGFWTHETNLAFVGPRFVSWVPQNSNNRNYNIMSRFTPNFTCMVWWAKKKW